MGDIIKTPVPFLGKNFILYNIFIEGTRKANVFPDPVLAAPKISFPLKK